MEKEINLWSQLLKFEWQASTRESSLLEQVFKDQSGFTKPINIIGRTKEERSRLKLAFISNVLEDFNVDRDTGNVS